MEAIETRETKGVQRENSSEKMRLEEENLNIQHD